MSLLLLLRNRADTAGVGGLTVTVAQGAPVAGWAGSVLADDGVGSPVDIGDPTVRVVVSSWHYVTVSTVTPAVTRTDAAVTVARTAGG